MGKSKAARAYGAALRAKEHDVCLRVEGRGKLGLRFDLVLEEDKDHAEICGRYWELVGGAVSEKWQGPTPTDGEAVQSLLWPGVCMCVTRWR
jgi:hypothetical protein